MSAVSTVQFLEMRSTGQITSSAPPPRSGLQAPHFLRQNSTVSLKNGRIRSTPLNFLLVQHSDSPIPPSAQSNGTETLKRPGRQHCLSGTESSHSSPPPTSSKHGQRDSSAFFSNNSCARVNCRHCSPLQTPHKGRRPPFFVERTRVPDSDPEQCLCQV